MSDVTPIPRVTCVEIPRLVCIERADGSFVDAARTAVVTTDGRLVRPAISLEAITHVVKAGEFVTFHRGRLPDRGTFETKRGHS